MKRNTLSKERLNESLSKKGVTFCEESSLLYFATEGTVDSLNNSAIHTVHNADFSSSPENSGRFKNFFNFCDKYISDQCLSNLPEARVILERLPEALIPTYFDSTECSQVCNATKTTAETSDLFISKNVAEPVRSKTSQRLKKNKYPLQDFKVSSADKYKSYIGKEVFPEGCSTVENCSQNFDCVGCDASLKVKANKKTTSKKFSKKLCEKNSVLQNKNADIKQNSLLQNSLQRSPLFIESKTFECISKSKRKHKECIKFVDYIASANNSSRKDCDEISFDKYPCVHLEKLNLEQYLENNSNYLDTALNKKNVPIDIELEVGNTTKMLNDLSVSEKNVPLTEKTSSKTVNLLSPKTDKMSTGNIFAGETYSTNEVLKGLLLGNLPKESRYVGSVMSNHKNNLKEASILQNENTVKCKGNKNSNSHKSAQNVFPLVLLEKLNLFPVDSDENCSTSSPEPVFKDIVPSVSDDPDLPIQIAEVCSISQKKFDKVQRYKNLTKNRNKVLERNKNFFNQFVKHKNTNVNIRKPKSLQLSSFNVSETSSKNTCVQAASDSSSEDTSSDNIPLISLSKRNNHSFHHSKDLSDDEIPLINISKTNANLPIGIKTKRKHINSKNQNDSTKIKSSQTPPGILNKEPKNKKLANSSKSHVEKKKSKKVLRKKQKKMYKMIMKYLKKQIKSKKHRKKSKKQKNHPEKPKSSESRMLVSLSDSESDDSVAVIYDSVDQQNNSIEKDSFQKDELPGQSKSMSHGESSITSKRDSKTKKAKKLVDKYRLGFLSKKHSLRFYNKFLASERLLLSKSKLKKNKKKELKKLFNKVKTVGLLNYK